MAKKNRSTGHIGFDGRDPTSHAIGVTKVNVRRFGYSLVPTPAVDNIAPYTYTVGMTALGRPELIVVGLGGNMAAGLLECLIPRHREQAWGSREQFLIPDRFRNGDAHEIYASFAEVENAPDYPLTLAHRLYPRSVRATQVVWPDVAGLRPPAPSFDGGNRAQPLLPVRIDVTQWQRKDTHAAD
jgi:hypothetical protein